MKVSSIRLPLIEDDGRYWICLVSGEVVEISHDVVLRQAKKSVGAAMSVTKTALEQAGESREWMDQKRLNVGLVWRWRRRLAHFFAVAQNAQCVNSDLQERWENRVDTSRNACVNMIKRESNLKGDGERERFGTWERFLDVAFERSMGGCDNGPWDRYALNVYYSLRRRFRKAKL